MSLFFLWHPLLPSPSTMLINTLFKYWTYRLFAPGVVLRGTYDAFRELLIFDSRSHELMADLEDSLGLT